MMSVILGLLAGLAVLLLLGSGIGQRRPVRSSEHLLVSNRIPYRGLHQIVPLVLATVGLVVGSPSLTLVGPLVWLGCRSLYRTSRRRKRAQVEEQELLAIVDQIVHELHSGNSLATAFVLGCQRQTDPKDKEHPGGEIGSALHMVADAVAAGERLEVGLERMLHAEEVKDPNPALRLLGVAVIVLVESGGPAGPAIERLSETLRARQAGLDEIRSQASQATASAVVLAGLPLVFALLLASADHRVARFYFSSMPGAVCIVGSLLLVAAGWAWIQKLVWS